MNIVQEQSLAIAELENEAARLREELEKVHAENTRLRESIEWALGEGTSEFGDIINPKKGKYWWREELRARAFPPKMETVEVKRWAVIAPSGYVETSFESEERAIAATHRDEYSGYAVVSLTGHYQRPIPAKTKRREEVAINTGTDGTIRYLNTRATCPGVERRFFAEWEE